MSMVLVVDLLRDLVEPDKRYQDDSLDRPQSADIASDIWYLWPIAETFEQDAGSNDLQRWQVGVIWATDRGAEVGGAPRRDVSEAIIEKVEHLRSTIRSARSVATADGVTVWENAEVAEVDYERLRTNVLRGFIGRVDGYLYRTD